MFITFEGGEGSGKTIQIDRLAAALREAGREVVTTREPGGSPGAEALRHVLLSGRAKPLGPDLETVLFAAARADHVATLIRPALARGADVLCDRFHDSTRVYQGRDAKAGLVAVLEEAALQDAYPDITLVLDIPAEEGLARAAARRGEAGADRFEAEAVEVHEARRATFLRIASREPDRCRIVDASLPIEEVAERIRRIVIAWLDDRLSEGEVRDDDPVTAAPVS